MKTALVNVLVLAFFSMLTCVGCLYPHDKPNVLYGGVPFHFGTNAPVEIHTSLRAAGSYHLYFLLRKDSLPHDGKGHVPLWLDTPVHVLVMTNGHSALDKEVSRLYCINRDNEEANYSLALFHGEKDADAVCRVQDVSGGSFRGEGNLYLQQIRHH
jgi:hypothetical protein